MKYECISADSHIDIVWLPGDLFVSSAPMSVKYAMPRVEESEEGSIWVAEGARLGWAGAAALDGHGNWECVKMNAGRYFLPIIVRSHRFSRVIAELVLMFFRRVLVQYTHVHVGGWS